jgi:uncharacterized membrane protein YkvA (DUF1232 family)
MDKTPDEQEVLATVDAKLTSMTRNPAKGLLHNIKLLVTMLRDKNFHMERSSRLLIIGALVYFVLPTDLTPDFIPGIGYIDDLAVIMGVLKRLAHEVNRYRAQTF